MWYVACFFVGLIVGAFCLFLYFMDWYKKHRANEVASQLEVKKANDALEATKVSAKQFVDEARANTNQLMQAAKTKEEDIERRGAELAAQVEEFKRRIISYRELQQENTILKRDVQNIDVNLRKFEIDVELQAQRQKELDERSSQLAKRYLGETIKSVISSIGPSNFTACKQRLQDVIKRCRDIGFDVPSEEEDRLLADLRTEFQKAVRAAFEREEQIRIRAQIREEEQLKREVDRELKQLERERAAIQAALDQALAEAKGLHSAEVERLQARLAEAEEKSKRAVSMAQQTKAGHVYVISNIGTFGEGVFKIGMTRRLEPMDRVYELSCAAVPFPFDVHMMIACDDAPTLENALHRAFGKQRLNRVNPRKEFFRAGIEEIHKIVQAHHGEVQFVADPEAAEYRQSLVASDEDQAFIENVFDAVEEELPKD